MRLSNTMMINASLLPSSKKAFTLAEVLITLSILGVVAALTIPSLVNRQSEMAAQVKLKKAIANYENVAAVYMVENESTDLSGITKNTAGNANDCSNMGNYFKIVKQNNSNKCIFTTADGVIWLFSTAGNPVIMDSENSPRYAVSMWTAGGGVNQTGDNNSGGTFTPETSSILNTADLKATDNSTALTPLNGYYTANTFLNSKNSDLANKTGKVASPRKAVDSQAEDDSN